MLVLPETPIVTSLICGTVFPGGRSHWLGSLKVVQCQLVSREREKQAIFLLVLGCGVHPKLSTTREEDWICCLHPIRPSSIFLSWPYS